MDRSLQCVWRNQKPAGIHCARVRKPVVQKVCDTKPCSKMCKYIFIELNWCYIRNVHYFFQFSPTIFKVLSYAVTNEILIEYFTVYVFINSLSECYPRVFPACRDRSRFCANIPYNLCLMKKYRQRCCLTCLLKERQNNHHNWMTKGDCSEMVLNYLSLWCKSAVVCGYLTQRTQNICITFIQCRINVADVGPTLYKCYTNVLCLLGYSLTLSTVSEHSRRVHQQWRSILSSLIGYC